jgi:hypothetical protein
VAVVVVWLSLVTVMKVVLRVVNQTYGIDFITRKHLAT